MTTSLPLHYHTKTHHWPNVLRPAGLSLLLVLLMCAE
jgi:hypothetical protein